MKIQTIIVLLFCWVILSGCPEEVGVDLNTPIFLTNQSNDSLRYKASFRFVDTQQDTSIQEVILEGFYEDLSDYRVLLPMDTVELFRQNRESLEIGVPAPIMYFIFNIDTLENLSTEEVLATERGVTKYLFRSIDDYEANDFTLVYPKE
ncbi:MAG: hypothetical protein WBB45_05110 [Cyclobacteriaceae bacterium]